MTAPITQEHITKPEWINESLYPFQSHYFQLSGGRMHYIDEGEGPVLLFVHGTPAWSIVYRKQIKALSENYRCIAVDHLGFGLSDKPKDYDYHPRQLSENLEKLVEHLGLEDISLVVHDFGGPIGLSYALRRPDKVSRLVLFNTWLWGTRDNEEVQKVDKLINSFLGKFLYLYLNASPRFLIPSTFDDKGKLSKELHKHYRKAFPSKNDRYGPYRIAQALLGASDFYQEQWDQIDRIKDKPTLLLWEMKDSFIQPEYLKKWERTLTNYRTVKYECGHFVQEEAGEEAAAEMERFLDRR